MFLWLFVNSVFQKSYKWPSAGSEWTGSNFSQKLLPDPLDSCTVVIYPFGGRCLIFIFTFGSRVERKASIQQDPQIALTHISERLHPFSCFSLSPQTPETEEINLNLHTYILITVTCSYIILFVYLFSLCSTALCSCRTGERSEEDFVCMEISLVSLVGITQTVELFDAGSFVNCWDAFFFGQHCTQAKGKEGKGEDPAPWWKGCYQMLLLMGPQSGAAVVQ